MSASNVSRKISLAEAVVRCRCPKCRTGKMFDSPAYAPGKLTQMNKVCKVCGTDFRQEPGFYFGAMYVSYAFNVAIMLTFFVATYVLLDPKELYVYIIAILTPSFLFFPLNFRLSRAIFLHVFGGIARETAEEARNRP